MKFLDQFASMMAWQTAGLYAYGLCGGLPFCVKRDDKVSTAMAQTAFTAKENAFGVTPVTVYLADTGALGVKRMEDFLEMNKKEHHLAGKFSMDARSITVMMHRAMGPVKAQDAKAFTEAFAAFLNDHGVRPGCAACGKEGGFDFYGHDAMAMPLCPDCAQNASQLQQEREAVSREGSYATGILGAVLGGIVGIIPWILISLLGYVSALGGLLMAWAAYYGYKLFRGKLHRKGAVIAVVITVVIVTTFLAAIFSVCAEVVRQDLVADYGDFGTVLSVWFTIPFIPEWAAETGIWSVIGEAYIFSLLGVVFWALAFNKKSKAGFKKIGKLGP